MFANLQSRPTDSLLGLIAAFKADVRPEKIDVGVGVYRDESGQTPVMRAVKSAEDRLLREQQSKTYLGMAGEPLFNAAMTDLVMGPLVTQLGERLRAVQTAGGCAALRGLADLIAISMPNAKLWVSDPTWINHIPLMSAARLEIARYPYFDQKTQSLNFTAMLDCLRLRGPGDVVLLHAACHNPTGTDLSDAQWVELTDLALERGFLPFIDLAYQGLGRGLNEDAFGVRHMASRLPELLVAVSCSKSFGIYRERAGLAMVLGESSASAKNMLDHLMTAFRGSYSMPPDHGAATVQMILNDPLLRDDWDNELTVMRNRISGLRSELVRQLRDTTQSDRFDYIEKQFGMFSLLDLTVEQVERLRQDFAVYMPSDSRTNIAGLTTNLISPFARAIATVIT